MTRQSYHVSLFGRWARRSAKHDDFLTSLAATDVVAVIRSQGHGAL